MKNLLLAFIFLPLTGFAQPIQSALIEAHCVDLKSLDTLLSEFNETPFIRGESSRKGVGLIPFVLFVNPSTGSWTFAERVENNTYCVVGLGRNLHAVPKEIRDDLEKERKGSIL